MQNVATWFAEGGWGMYPVVLLGGVSVLAGVAHAAVARGLTLLISIAFAGLTMLAGLGATWSGRATTEAAISQLSPAVREQIRAVGYAEAQHPTKLALGLVVIVAVPLLVGELRRMIRSSSEGAGGSTAQ